MLRIYKLLKSFGHPAGWRKLCREHSPLFSASSLDLSGCLFFLSCFPICTDSFQRCFTSSQGLLRVQAGVERKPKGKEWASNYGSGSVFQVMLMWRQHLPSPRRKGFTVSSAVHQVSNIWKESTLPMLYEPWFSAIRFDPQEASPSSSMNGSDV